MLRLLSPLPLISLMALSGCSSQFEALKASISIDQSSLAPVSGRKLYESNCATCHGSLEQSTKANKAVSDITFAINNIETMASMKFLTAKEIEAIAEALKEDPVTPDDLTFEMAVSFDPLPFKTRYGKIVHLLGSSMSTSLSKLNSDRFLLGDYDFANSIISKYSWEVSDMSSWILAIEPVCASAEFRSRYSWPSGANQFVIDAYGRAPASDETNAVNTINGITATAQEKFEVFCLATLTSMEFVAK